MSYEERKIAIKKPKILNIYIILHLIDMEHTIYGGLDEMPLL